MKEQEIKISVIVPVYNVEKYLEECLDSLINQTLKEIEILVMNDGSTDSSQDIIDMYAARDKRIKTYSHANIGLGPTRNRALTFAKGEYVAFVDSDDSMPTNALELLYISAVKNKSDVVVGEVMLTYEDEKKIIYELRCIISSQFILMILINECFIKSIILYVCIHITLGIKYIKENFY